MFICFFVAIATITVDEGTITWFSAEEVYYEKNKASMFEKFIKQIGRQCKKIIWLCLNNLRMVNKLIEIDFFSSFKPVLK